jgi:pilus assembly protein Flp/PilA
MITRLYNYWYNIKETVKDNKGQGMVEYALIIGLVSVVAIVILGSMGGKITDKFQAIVTALTTP